LLARASVVRSTVAHAFELHYRRTVESRAPMKNAAFGRNCSVTLIYCAATNAHHDAMSELQKASRVLFIGQEPETVDFSDPALPPGFNAAKIHAGIAAGMKVMADRGWQADLCLVRPDDTARSDVQQQLASVSYDCVVIGGGIRVPPKSLLLFEMMVNTVHQAAPSAAIAFNTKPEDTADAAARWLK
jgi:hypothetical protein